MTDIVLAGSYTETNAFIRQKGLGYGVRHVVNKDQIRAVRPSAVHVLPSFYKRRDIHSFKSPIARIKRMYPKTPFIEYEKGYSGAYVAVDGPFEPVDPPVNPQKSKIAVDPPPPAVDTGPNAVPGQISVEEAIAAAQNPRSEPTDDLLDFLDS